MKNLLLKLFSVVIVSSVLLACEKDDDAKTKVMVIHASPNAPNVDVRVNNAIAFSNLPFPENTAYTSINAGSTNIKVSPTGTTTYVIDATTTLAENKNYSVFAIDSVSKIKLAAVEDNLAAPAAGKAHVRFFHFSPNAPAVDIAVTGGPVLFANRTFNDQSTNNAVIAFTPVNAGTYNLEVRPAGSTTVVLALPNITLESGKIYTVFAKGLLGEGGTKALGAKIIVNN
jgi:uncharacterized protein DUF4397